MRSVATEDPTAQKIMSRHTAAAALPRLGFLGVGWIGRNRMEAIARSGAAEVAAIADPLAEMRAAAAGVAKQAEITDSLDSLLDADLDGVVIATPSGLHAEQSIRALERGLAVFCQKPLGRTAAETRDVVEAARRANRLLGVDFSYRFTAAMAELHRIIRDGGLGRIYAADLVFHNAYGPDKPWFRDKRLSGGGCVVDLGIHLVDLALWMLDFPAVEAIDARLFSRGARIGPDDDRVEDYAVARLDVAGGTSVQLACSWDLHAGRDAVISATFYGTEGGARMSNVGGSFYDFRAEMAVGTASRTVAAPPDDWGGRAAVEWARRLGRGERFDPAAARIVEVAAVIDGIYGR